MDQTRQQYLVYMVFAAAAIALNVAVQVVVREVFLALLPSLASQVILSFEYWFVAALGAGTVAGFVFKFVVDKLVIFGEGAASFQDVGRTGRQVVLYFGFALITTAIFWGTELSFKVLFSGDVYLVGGVLGLAVGYTLKFLLDRTFVFVPEQPGNI